MAKRGRGARRGARTARSRALLHERVATATPPAYMTRAFLRRLGFGARHTYSPAPAEPAGRACVSPSAGAAPPPRTTGMRRRAALPYRRRATALVSVPACDSADAPLIASGGTGCTHLLALPDDLLARILASFTSGERLRAITGAVFVPPGLPPDEYGPGHWRGQRHALSWAESGSGLHRVGFTVGQALAGAGACCKVFAIHEHAAATIVADRHGWSVPPVVGRTPTRHLSKLEEDAQRVRGWLERVPKLDLSVSNIGTLLVDRQVLRQYTLELGEMLIDLLIPLPLSPLSLAGLVALQSALSTGARRAAYNAQQLRNAALQYTRLENHLKAFDQLVQLMSQPGTPLNASWLAGKVGTEQKRVKLRELLGKLGPRVLRNHPEVFELLTRSLS